MDGFELSIVINRPIEEVFAILADLENDIRWRREWAETNLAKIVPNIDGLMVLL